MEIWFLISFIVGVVLALTGSGGGLVSIPLFISLAGFDLKTATILSLLTVMIGAFFGWLPQRRHTQKISSVLMFASSFGASSVASQFKSTLPVLWIRILIIGLCLFSLAEFWKSKSKPPAANLTPAPSDHIHPTFIAKNLMAGFLVGILTTLTGLGGGVLLVPIMLRLLGFGLTEAIATSLLTVMLASAGSLWFQLDALLAHITLRIFLVLIGGVVTSSFTLKLLLQRVSSNKLLLIKKITFTLVVIWTIVSLTVS